MRYAISIDDPTWQFPESRFMRVGVDSHLLTFDSESQAEDWGAAHVAKYPHLKGFSVHPVDDVSVKENKKIRVRMGQLRQLFTEGALGRLLNEEDDSISHETGVSGESLDAQVDKYLGQYEAESKKTDEPSADQMEALDWRDLVKGQVISEAGEGDKDAEETPDDAAPGADQLTGADASKLGLDKLDVEKFANDVVRLIDNYDSLLEIRSTLMRRATSFLQKSYSDEVVKAFKDVLRDDHGLEAGSSKGEIEADEFPAPPAARANGSAAPGPGGSAAGA